VQTIGFDEEGRLPPGDYEMTLAEISTSILVTQQFDGRDTNWDENWRMKLVENLRIMAQQLWDEGITEIFIDGSFATDKPKPGDIDGYFVVQKPEGMSDFEFEEHLCAQLNERDRHKVWTWKDSDRRKPSEAEKGQLPMWWQYHVEMWPEYGQSSNQVHPVTGKELTHADLFRITKFTGEEKGIIKLIKD
jgi:hypothetical protein